MFVAYSLHYGSKNQNFLKSVKMMIPISQLSFSKSCIYKNYTFKSVILESLQMKVSKCPSSICFDTTEAMLLLNKELKPNMVWGLWPETKCGIFLKNNFFFFLRDSKAQKLFSFLLLYNSVQITHIFFCKKTFSFQCLFTNYKHQAIHQNLYLFKRARKNIFAIR